MLDPDEIVYAGLEGGHVTVKTLIRHTRFTIHWLYSNKAFADGIDQGAQKFLANMDHIKQVKPWFNSTYNLLMKDGSTIPVSRTYAKELKNGCIWCEK
ncbi:LytTR family DNA-binding domain-containing protein [Bacillus licheniformis]|nr:LytTR family DNA-binding domain-containing protein [Bacillus licheniformis]